LCLQKYQFFAELCKSSFKSENTDSLDIELLIELGLIEEGLWDSGNANY